MKARLPKGMGQGGPGNMNQMIMQAQKIQEDMTKAQDEINEKEFTASVGGGMVDVVMTGDKQIKGINIKPEVVDPEDVEMLEDLLMAALNQVIKEIETETNERMDSISGGLNIPGVF